MAEVSQKGDCFAFWCLSDIYNQCGYQSSEFQGNYGMLSLHGLRKPAWFAHQLLEKLGRRSVPVTGGDPLTGGIATNGPDGQRILVYAYPENPEAAPESQEISITIPEQAKGVRLTRIGARENNAIAQWRAIGAPPYPTREQINQLRSENTLQPASVAEIQIHDTTATFRMERPGVALLEVD
jgi:xylan 1,4-beta-xylosidase